VPRPVRLGPYWIEAVRACDHVNMLGHNTPNA